jgi:segregation and condensation protein B
MVRNLVEDLKKKVEALLFSAGSKLEFEEIRKLCRAKDDDLKIVLEELKKEYEEKDSSIMIVNEGTGWKLTIREKYVSVVRRIVTQTELSKSIMETLAVIAWKYPVVQSEVIRIRTNKAYDHMNELEELGYITRQKYGRTKLIKLTQKFFDYFDLPPDKVKEVFKDFNDIAQAIEKKEDEIVQQSEKQNLEIQPAEQVPAASVVEGKSENTATPEIDLFDKDGQKQKLEVIETPKDDTNRLGNLEIIDEPEVVDSSKIAELPVKTDSVEIDEQVEQKVEELLNPNIDISEPKQKVPDSDMESEKTEVTESDDVDEAENLEEEK